MCVFVSEDRIFQCWKVSIRGACLLICFPPKQLDSKGKEVKVEVRYGSILARCCSTGCKLQEKVTVSQRKAANFTNDMCDGV